MKLQETTDLTEQLGTLLSEAREVMPDVLTEYLQIMAIYNWVGVGVGLMFIVAAIVFIWWELKSDYDSGAWLAALLTAVIGLPLLLMCGLALVSIYITPRAYLLDHLMP